jgi:hypothetical protein
MKAARRFFRSARMRGFKEHEAADRFCREYVMNSATSSAADPVTTNTFQQPADAVIFSSTPASRWASCRSHNQKGRRHTEFSVA